MDKLPDNISEEDFMKLAELHHKYEESKLLIRYHKMINSSVEIVIPIIENMEKLKKEFIDFQKMN